MQIHYQKGTLDVDVEGRYSIPISEMTISICCPLICKFVTVISGPSGLCQQSHTLVAGTVTSAYPKLAVIFTIQKFTRGMFDMGLGMNPTKWIPQHAKSNYEKDSEKS